MPAKPIFISYSRAQRVFAEKLYGDLVKLGHTVLRDLHELKGGDDWWRQLKEMIDQSESVVLCLSQEAVDSKNVLKELDYARELGRRIIPVAAADVNFDILKIGWLKRAHSYDFRASTKEHKLAWDRFVNQLKTAYEPRKVPFMVDALPPDFVQRPDVFEPLVAALLHESTTPVAITTALRGAGGYGKTTQARAICHDPRIRARYDDGILWVTLGESVTENDRTSKLLDLCERLTGQRPAVSSLDAAHDALRHAIGDRYILLVIDDVWRVGDAQPFLTNAPHSAVLITTRDRNVLPLNSQPFPVDAMKVEQAVELLAWQVADWQGQRAAFAGLAARLGEWALMLKLANGALRKRLADGDTLPAALAWMEKALTRRGLAQVFAGDDPASRHRTAAASLAVSLDMLTADQRRQLNQLAIFPEDIDIPLATLEKLWGVDDFDVEDITQRLYDRSLLLNFDLKARLIRLHDVVRTILREEQKDVLPALNAAFLQSYGLNEWWELLPTEPYLWRFIGYHLLEAGQPAALRALLFDYRWLRAKLDATDINALLADCALLNPPTDEPLRLLQTALLLSANVLPDYKEQLASQLRGRLLTYVESHPDLQSLLAQTETTNGLLPLNPGLRPAGGHLLRTLQGHTDAVWGALVLPDGRVLSWSNDRTLRLWQANGSQQATLSGHTHYVQGALVLPDGRFLSWSRDETLRLWGSDGRALATLSGHTDAVNGALVLPDGRFLSWSQDSTLRLWGSDGRALVTLSGHTHYVQGALVLPDGRVLSWSQDSTLRLWGSDGRALVTLSGHTHYVQGALVLPDGRVLSWSWDKTLRLWGSDGRALATLSGHTDAVNGALVLPDGRVLSWSWDKTLRLWGSDGRALATLSGHTASVRGALVLPDGRFLSWAGGLDLDYTLRLWGSDGRALVTLSGHTDAVWGALVLPDGRFLSWSDDRTLRLWQANGSQQATLSGHTASVRGALVLPDGRFLSWAGGLDLDYTLRLWGSDGRALATLSGHTDAVNGALVLPDGRVLSWSNDRTLRLWGSDGRALATLSGHTDAVNGALVLPDGRVLSWSNDRTLRLWGSDGRALATLSGHTDAVNGALVLPDGRVLSWSNDRTLRLWQANGIQQATLSGHTASVRGALVLPDGRFLSWSWDKTLRLWQANGSQQATLSGHTDGVRGALVLPDGRVLSWAGRFGLSDRTLRLWGSDGRALATLSGHTDGVRGALVLPDGRFLSWSWDETLRLWGSDGRALVTLSGHTGAVSDALVLPDGRFLSWAGGFDSTDYRLRLWQANGSQQATLSGHTDGVTGALVLPDGRFLSWSQDSTLRLWSSTGESLTVFTADAPITCATLSHDQRVVVAGDAEGRVMFLRLPPG